jgi:O-antigen ligase
MFALPGLLLLVLVDYVRPQEYFLSLRAIPLLYVATGLTALGILLDLRLGISRLRAAPHFLLAVLFVAWSAVTLVVRAPGELLERLPELLIPFAFYLLVAQAVQSFKALQVLGGLLLAIGLGLASIGVHQAMAPQGCHREVMEHGHQALVFDGRSCDPEDPHACENEGAEPGQDYRCERIGLMGTSSIRGRVRYRGTLEDPNELALVLGMALPFAFAFFDRRASLARLLLVAISVGLVGACTYFTQSRGGQLVFLTVLAVYFVKRYGIRRGLVSGLLLALPILLFGGRTGGESSTEQRTEAWWVGLHLFQASPGFGVGAGRFTEHHDLTAHNSLILAAAELGAPGLLIFAAILYLAAKVSVQALRSGVAPVARTWALALLASTSGLLVGTFFLSFVYKNALWIQVGMTGALHQAIQRHDPAFQVRFGFADLALVSLVIALLLVSLVAYTGLKMGW